VEIFDNSGYVLACQQGFRFSNVTLYARTCCRPSYDGARRRIMTFYYWKRRGGIFISLDVCTCGLREILLLFPLTNSSVAILVRSRDLACSSSQVSHVHIMETLH